MLYHDKSVSFYILFNSLFWRFRQLSPYFVCFWIVKTFLYHFFILTLFACNNEKKYWNSIYRLWNYTLSMQLIRYFVSHSKQPWWYVLHQKTNFPVPVELDSYIDSKSFTLWQITPCSLYGAEKRNCTDKMTPMGIAHQYRSHIMTRSINLATRIIILTLKSCMSWVFLLSQPTLRDKLYWKQKFDIGRMDNCLIAIKMANMKIRWKGSSSSKCAVRWWNDIL